MKLLGDWNWYLPKWLEWLPQVSPEPEPEPSRASARPKLLPRHAPASPRRAHALAQSALASLTL